MQQKIARARRDTIGEALSRSAESRPEKTAITFGDRAWTYAELDLAADRLASGLLALGMEPGDRVAAYGKNSDAYAILWLACARAGIIHVPINFSLTGDELRYIIEQSGARALFHDQSLPEAVDAIWDDTAAETRGTLYGGSGLDALTMAGESDSEELETIPSGDDVVQLLYTSGTTAAPKGAMMTHRAFLAHYASCIEALELDREDRVLNALPLYHSAPMHCQLMPHLLAGAAVHIVTVPDPETCFEAIQEKEITTLFAAPTVWIGFLRHPAFDDYDLTSLVKLFYGASIMPVPVLEELRERLPNANPYNGYGQSEIGPLATILKPAEHDERPSSAGKPVLNVRTRVVDPEMNDVEPGEHGEIVHRSPQLMVGYWDKPEETEEVFEGDWFHSGDLGYVDEEGYLYVVDRVKDVINTGGIVVSGREVEDALYGHDSVSEVAVIALPDDKWIEAVGAVVALRDGFEGSDALATELQDFARQSLAPFKTPKQVFFVEDLPRNTAGKVLKRELRERFAQAAPSEA